MTRHEKVVRPHVPQADEIDDEGLERLADAFIEREENHEPGVLTEDEIADAVVREIEERIDRLRRIDARDALSILRSSAFFLSIAPRVQELYEEIQKAGEEAMTRKAIILILVAELAMPRVRPATRRENMKILLGIRREMDKSEATANAQTIRSLKRQRSKLDAELDRAQKTATSAEAKAEELFAKLKIIKLEAASLRRQLKDALSHTKYKEASHAAKEEATEPVGPSAVASAAFGASVEREEDEDVD